MQDKKMKKELKRPLAVEELGLSLRAYNVLKRNQIGTAEDAAGLSYKVISGFRGCGKLTRKEIAGKLKEAGYYPEFARKEAV